MLNEYKPYIKVQSKFLAADMVTASILRQFAGSWYMVYRFDRSMNRWVKCRKKVEATPPDAFSEYITPLSEEELFLEML